MNEPKTVFPLVSTCPTPSKIQFQTRAEAEEFELGNRAEYGPQRVYLCEPGCGQFHLTKQEKPLEVSVPSALPQMPVCNPELEEKIKAFCHAGVSLDDIVAKVGEAHSTVRYYIQKISGDARARRAEAQPALPSRRGRPLGSVNRPTTMESIATKKAELEAQMRKLQAEEAQLIEQAKIRVMWYVEKGKNLLMVRHNGLSAAFPLESWREALPLIVEQIRQVDANEKLLPGETGDES